MTQWEFQPTSVIAAGQRSLDLFDSVHVFVWCLLLLLLMVNKVMVAA